MSITYFCYRSYYVAFYHAHLEDYVINFFILLGKLLTVALVVKPLKGLLLPFREIRQGESIRISCTVLAGLCLFVALYLSPVVCEHNIIPNANRTLYCIVNGQQVWLRYIRYVNAALFELSFLTSFVFMCQNT